jgi:hypothetical protein
VATDTFTEIGGTPTEHPPHSPDLVPCDFWAFPTTKGNSEVKTACSTILLKLAANCLQHVFDKRVERCKKCIAYQGRHSEKQTVNLHRVSDSE